MENNITAFPLCWPEGYPRTIGEKDWWAKAPTPGAARDGLFRELEKMKATDVVLSTNVPTTKGGTFYASYKEPSDNGVAVYFTLEGTKRVLACDAYARMNMNIRAISLTLDELRRISKRKVADFENRVFTGFAALPPPGIATPSWYEVLGVSVSSDDDTVKHEYRKLCKQYHPDTGIEPDTLKFQQVNEAWRQYQTFK